MGLILANISAQWDSPATPFQLPQGVRVESQTQNFDPGSKVTCAITNPTSLVQPARVTLLLSSDGGANFVPADLRVFKLFDPTDQVTFDLAKYADHVYAGPALYRSAFQDVDGNTGTVPVVPGVTAGAVSKVFSPPWTHFRILVEGSYGGTVGVMASIN